MQMIGGHDVVHPFGLLGVRNCGKYSYEHVMRRASASGCRLVDVRPCLVDIRRKGGESDKVVADKQLPSFCSYSLETVFQFGFVALVVSAVDGVIPLTAVDGFNPVIQ